MNCGRVDLLKLADWGNRKIDPFIVSAPIVPKEFGRSEEYVELCRTASKKADANSTWLHGVSCSAGRVCRSIFSIKKLPFPQLLFFQPDVTILWNDILMRAHE